MRHHRIVPVRPALVVGLLAVIALVLWSLAPASFAYDPDGTTLTVTHGPVSITLANPQSDGHQPGDLRVTSLPIADVSGATVGRLDSTLTTVGIDVPNVGDEVRISTLIFSFGDGSDQVVVNGTALYPKAAPTIASSTSVVRPITGGSGMYAGVGGWAETEHLADGTWRHTFHFDRGDEHEHGHPGESSAPATDEAGASPTTPVGGIIRTLLGDVAPTTADGQTLSLWHYTIPAGAALVPHTHPGFQVARVVSGELTYNVIDGEVTILRGDGSTETGTTGQVLIVRAGDTVIENPDLAHFGANAGTEPVEIYAASLFETGSPPAIPLPTTAP
jgi:quercetin dioxygenase-like cupin family protein